MPDRRAPLPQVGSALPGVLMLEDLAMGSAQQRHTTASQDARGQTRMNPSSSTPARGFSPPTLPRWGRCSTRRRSERHNSHTPHTYKRGETAGGLPSRPGGLGDGQPFDHHTIWHGSSIARLHARVGCPECTVWHGFPQCARGILSLWTRTRARPSQPPWSDHPAAVEPPRLVSPRGSLCDAPYQEPTPGLYPTQ